MVEEAIKDYEDLTEAEKSELSHAWLDVLKGLEVYERITGAELSDVIADEIWESVNWQKVNPEL